MLDHPSDKVEAGRILVGTMRSAKGTIWGAFVVVGPSGRALRIISDDGRAANERADLLGWEHVSVSIEGKHPPNWQEMNWVKNQFWPDDETVMQFHPKRSQYVNIHPNCLHLWRKAGSDAELPPQLLV